MTMKARRPLIAALLTLVTRGFGHLYAGEPKKGLVLFSVELLFVTVFAVSSLSILPNVSALAAAVLAGSAFLLYCIYDAVSISRKKRNYELAKYNSASVYAGCFVIFSLLIPLLVSAAIKTYIVQAYKVPGGSMVPSLLIGDYFLVNKHIYRTSEPKRGEIIVFPFPEDTERDFVKRLIAIGGDTVEIRNKKLYVNDREQIEPYKIHTDRRMRAKRDNVGPITVPHGQLFFLGDNRDYSYDSRFWGFVPRDAIKGRAISLYWSWDAETGSVRWVRIGRAVQ